MGEELLSLRWNNHQSHFVDILTFLREQEVFIDVTLACGGKLYPAHKFVLSTCSDYFKQMFTKIPDKHPIVFMKDVLCKDLEALLDFMYHGEVNVPQSSLGSLIKTAEGLQIKGLAVPDDPPAPKSSAAKDRREPKARDNSYSPSPKRLRTRDKSPPPAPAVSNSNNVSQNNYTSRKSVDIPSSDPLSTDIADEDSRNSLVGDSISSVNNAKSHSNSSQLSANSRVNSPSETTNHAASGANSSPGPSGLQPSKEEQVDIKQEDEVVELDDQGDWVGGLESDGRESGLVDGMMGVDAAPNFSDLLANPSDSALNTSSPGDPAMINREPRVVSASSRSLHHHYSVDRDPDVFSDHGGFHPSFDAPHVDEWPEAAEPRPHYCPYCGSTFKRKGTLAEHLRIHSGELPFACSGCGRKFRQRGTLGRHLKNCPVYLNLCVHPSPVTAPP